MDSPSFYKHMHPGVRSVVTCTNTHGSNWLAFLRDEQKKPVPDPELIRTIENGLSRIAIKDAPREVDLPYWWPLIDAILTGFRRQIIFDPSQGEDAGDDVSLVQWVARIWDKLWQDHSAHVIRDGIDFEDTDEDKDKPRFLELHERVVGRIFFLAARFAEHPVKGMLGVFESELVEAVIQTCEDFNREHYRVSDGWPVAVPLRGAA